MTDKKQCVAKVHDGVRWVSFHPCMNRAKHEHDGEWYCGTHYPPNIAKRKQAGREKSERAYKASSLRGQIGRAASAIVAAADAWESATPETANGCRLQLTEAVLEWRELKRQLAEIAR